MENSCSGESPRRGATETATGRERERGRQRREETASDSQRKARFGVFIYPGLLFTPFRWFMHFSIAAKTLKNNIT